MKSLHICNKLKNSTLKINGVPIIIMECTIEPLYFGCSCKYPDQLMGILLSGVDLFNKSIQYVTYCFLELVLHAQVI